MCRMLFVTFLGQYRGDVAPSELGMSEAEASGASTATTAGHEDVHEAHAPSWLMNVPVAILIVPTIFIGWLMFGGENSPWSRFFAAQFPAQHLAAPALSEGLTGMLTLVVVLIGIGVAWMRYATANATQNAVARLREESVKMPAVLANAFYFDAALDAIFVRPAQLLGTFFGRFFDPHVIDGAVRETVFSVQWLGSLMRSFQTGLLRAYAFILVFGVACFVVYYAVVAGGTH